MANYTFKSMRITGPEGKVRTLFRNRTMQGADAEKMFPGVPNVAILPKECDGEEAAEEYLKGIIEQGGNAAAVRISSNEWLLAAWVLDENA